MKTDIKRKLKKEFSNLVASEYDKVKKLVRELLNEFAYSCQYRHECVDFSENCWRCAGNSQEFLSDLYILLKQFSLLQKIKREVF